MRPRAWMPDVRSVATPVEALAKRPEDRATCRQ
jgi:hypothetical protein